MNLHQHVQRAIARLKVPGIQIAKRCLSGEKSLVTKIKKIVTWVNNGEKYTVIVKPELENTWQLTKLGEFTHEQLQAAEERVYYALHSDEECFFLIAQHDFVGEDDVLHVVRDVPEYMLANLGNAEAIDPATEAQAAV